MVGKADDVASKYKPLKERNIVNTLSRCLHEQFPRIGGPRIRALCAEMILETLEQNLIQKNRLSHGQIVWNAIAQDDPPRRHKEANETKTVPVILSLTTPEDIQSRIDRKSPKERLLSKVLRLCQETFEQGGLLSNSDLSELLLKDSSALGSMIAAYERENGCVIPRRATIHDVGTGVTHKRIICRKRFVDGKPSHIIAKETCHTRESVDRYLGMFSRVKQCRSEGLSQQQTAFTLSCSLNLVREYFDIDDEISAIEEKENV
jgi:Protein of unknown function (DUF1670)